MKKRKNTAADYFAELFNGNYERASDVAKQAFGNLNWKADRIQNVYADFGKGNLFEYIESAKLQVNQAKAGANITETLTDLPKNRGGFGRNTDPADFIFKDNTSFQAKVGKENFQKSLVNEKYSNMYKISTTDVYDATMQQLKDSFDRGELTKKEYIELTKWARRSLTDPKTGISSEGTSSKELEQFRGADGKIDVEAVRRYSNYKINKQLIGECAHTIGATTLANAIFSCIGSTISNVRKYNQNKITKEDCVKNIAKDSAKGAGHGFAVGSIGSGFRIIGFKKNIPILRNGCSSLIIANGTIDIGKSLYYFKKGELSFGDLIGSVAFDTVKTVANVMISTALAFNPFLSIASTIAFEITANSLRNLAKNETIDNDIVIFTKEVLDCFEKETKKLNKHLTKEINKHKNIQENFVKAYEACLINSEPELVDTINNLYKTLGSNKKAQSFKEFNDLMMSDEKLKY